MPRLWRIVSAPTNTLAERLTTDVEAAPTHLRALMLEAAQRVAQLEAALSKCYDSLDYRSDGKGAWSQLDADALAVAHRVLFGAQGATE